MTTLIRGGTVVNHDDHTRRPTFPAVHVANATWKELTAPKGGERAAVTQ